MYINNYMKTNCAKLIKIRYIQCISSDYRKFAYYHGISITCVGIDYVIV